MIRSARPARLRRAELRPLKRKTRKFRTGKLCLQRELQRVMQSLHRFLRRVFRPALRFPRRKLQVRLQDRQENKAGASAPAEEKEDSQSSLERDPFTGRPVRGDRTGKGRYSQVSLEDLDLFDK